MVLSRRRLTSIVGLLFTIVFVAIAAPAFGASGPLIQNGSVATGTVSGTIDPVTNVQDNWGMYLWAGETVLVDVDSTAIELQAFSPDTYFTATDAVGTLLAARVPGSGVPLRFTAGASGYYPLRVTSVGGHADYVVNAWFGKVMTYMALSGPTSVKTPYGGMASFAGTVYNPRTILVPDPPLGKVTVSWSSNGTSFWPWLTSDLDNGDFDITTTRATFEKTWWNIVYAGDDEFGPSAATFVITPYAQLNTLTATRTKTRTYRIRGTMRPLQVAGTYPARFYIERKVSGKWKAYGYLKAKASDGPYQDYSILTATKTFPYKGSWRIRPYFPGNAQILATWGAYFSLTVK